MKKTIAVLAMLAPIVMGLNGLVYAGEIDDFNSSSLPKLMPVKITPLSTNPSSCDISPLKHIEGQILNIPELARFVSCMDKPCSGTYSNGEKTTYSIDSAKSTENHTLDGRHSTTHLVGPSTIGNVSYRYERTSTLNIDKNNVASYSNVKFIASHGDCAYSIDTLANKAHMNAELHGNKFLGLDDHLRKVASF